MIWLHGRRAEVRVELAPPLLRLLLLLLLLPHLRLHRIRHSLSHHPPPSPPVSACQQRGRQRLRRHAPWDASGVTRRTRAAVERFMMDGHCSAAVDDAVAPTTATCLHAEEAAGAVGRLSAGRVATVR